MGTSPWEPLLGNLYLGTSIREPGGMGFGAAPLCSETFTMAEDPSSLRCWGKTFLQLDFDFKKKLIRNFNMDYDKQLVGFTT